MVKYLNLSNEDDCEEFSFTCVGNLDKWKTFGFDYQRVLFSLFKLHEINQFPYVNFFIIKSDFLMKFCHDNKKFERLFRCYFWLSCFFTTNAIFFVVNFSVKISEFLKIK